MSDLSPQNERESSQLQPKSPKTEEFLGNVVFPDALSILLNEQAAQLLVGGVHSKASSSQLVETQRGAQELYEVLRPFVDKYSAFLTDQTSAALHFLSEGDEVGVTTCKLLLDNKRDLGLPDTYRFGGKTVEATICFADKITTDEEEISKIDEKNSKNNLNFQQALFDLVIVVDRHLKSKEPVEERAKYEPLNKDFGTCLSGYVGTPFRSQLGKEDCWHKVTFSWKLDNPEDFSIKHYRQQNNQYLLVEWEFSESGAKTWITDTRLNIRVLIGQKVHNLREVLVEYELMGELSNGCTAHFNSCYDERQSQVAINNRPYFLKHLIVPGIDEQHLGWLNNWLETGLDHFRAMYARELIEPADRFLE